MIKTLCLSCLVCFFVTLVACGDEEPEKQDVYSFEQDGLSGLIINELSLTDVYLVAATNDGLYLKDLNEGNWIQNGLEGRDISAFTEIDENHWIVAERTSTGHELYESSDSGMTWEVLQTNFGGETDQGINDLEYFPETGKLYATGTGVVAESTDQGITWTPLIGSWDAIATGLDFVEIDPEKNMLWSGGQNAIEEFVLYQFDIQAEEEILHRGLVSSPSVAKSILFDPMDEDHVMIGAEGGIISSTDYGVNWTLVKDDHSTSKFTFGLLRDLDNPSTIYAGGWLKKFDDPQQLVLSVSKDNGSTWEEVVYEDNELFGGIYSMVSLMENGEQVLYLGLYKGGVFKVTVDQ